MNNLRSISQLALREIPVILEVSHMGRGLNIWWEARDEEYILTSWCLHGVHDAA
jgi:hypothetical protein